MGTEISDSRRKLTFIGVFVGIVLISHAILFTIGELFFYSGIIWVLMPFLGIYGAFTVMDIVDVSGKCNEIMCTANVVGWLIIAFNVVVALAIYYFIAKKITHYLLTKRKS